RETGNSSCVARFACSTSSGGLLDNCNGYPGAKGASRAGAPGSPDCSIRANHGWHGDAMLVLWSDVSRARSLRDHGHSGALLLRGVPSRLRGWFALAAIGKPMVDKFDNR